MTSLVSLQHTFLTPRHTQTHTCNRATECTSLQHTWKTHTVDELSRQNPVQVVKERTIQLCIAGARAVLGRHVLRSNLASCHATAVLAHIVQTFASFVNAAESSTRHSAVKCGAPDERTDLLDLGSPDLHYPPYSVANVGRATACATGASVAATMHAALDTPQSHSTIPIPITPFHASARFSSTAFCRYNAPS
eukprot:IDg21595t1